MIRILTNCRDCHEEVVISWDLDAQTVDVPDCPSCLSTSVAVELRRLFDEKVEKNASMIA